MKKVILFALLLWGTGTLFAHDGFVIGQPCPDFDVRNMEYYKHKTFNPRQVRGKWLILQFFELGCSANFSVLPRIDSLQRQLKKQLQVVMIGKNVPKENFPATQLKIYYDQYQKKYHYQMAVGYDASLFARLELRELLKQY